MLSFSAPTAIPPWLTRTAGVEAYCDYLCALGRDASMVRLPLAAKEEPRWEEDTPASSIRERHLVLLERSPVHLVSLYAARMDRRTVSLAHHYVVRAETDGRAPEEIYEARMGQSFRGVFTRSRTRLTFVGGALASKLQEDTGLRAALKRHLGPRDDLHVVPDVRRGLVRIVHVHPVSARRPLLLPEPTDFHEDFLPEPLLSAFERMALHIRSLSHTRTRAAG